MTLAAERVSVIRGGITILRSVTLAVRPGECVAVIGPNGAGKSTLLHALSGALTPTSGCCQLAGVPLAAWSPASLAQRRAVLPQAPSLVFPLMVREVVALGRSPHGGCSDRATDRRAVEGALEAADISHLAARAYTSLSGGERQRVHLARVLAQVWSDADAASTDDRYLLLDEPTNNLDIAHQQRLVSTASEFAARGQGVLAVLHDPNLAAQYADRLALLAYGELMAVGAPETVLTPDRMDDVFGTTTICRQHPRTGRPYVLPA